MKNYVQPGKVIDMIAPYAVVAGAGMLVGQALFGVAVDAIGSLATGEAYTEGVFDLAKSTTQPFSPGARLFWDNSAKNLCTTSTGNQEVAVALTTAATTDTTVRCKLGAALPAAT